MLNMQSQILSGPKSIHNNSYINIDRPSESNKRTHVSPKDYQKRKNNSAAGTSATQKRRKVTKPKKIILGKPCTGKQKMNLEELKALSRQIRPTSSSSATPLTKLNCRSPYSSANHHENIMLLSRNLRENLFRAKSRMMDSLKNSTEPQALQIYKDLTNQSTCSITNTTIRSSGSSVARATNNSPPFEATSSEDEDDCSSVSTLSSLQLRLVTDESGHVSVVSSDYQPVPSSKAAVSIPPSFTVDVKQDNFFVGQDVTCPTSFMSLYTPNYYPSMLDMELFLTNWPLFEKNTDYSQSTDVTEEQINSWLQRGGHNDTITMATDQELADLLDFDDM